VWPWLLALGVGVASGLGGGVTSALWTSQAGVGGLAAHHEVTGFSVQRDDGTPDVAAGPGDVVGFDLAAADAQAIASAPSHAVAIGFQVAMMTSGTNGLDYRIDVADPAPDSFLAGADIEVFPQGDGGCAVGAVPGQVPTQPTGEVVGVAPSPTPRPQASVATQAWCLVATQHADTYANEAVAQGTNAAGGTVTSNTASWQSVLGPDPAAQPPVPITVTHVTTTLATATP